MTWKRRERKRKKTLCANVFDTPEANKTKEMVCKEKKISFWKHSAKKKHYANKHRTHNSCHGCGDLRCYVAFNFPQETSLPGQQVLLIILSVQPGIVCITRWQMRNIWKQGAALMEWLRTFVYWVFFCEVEPMSWPSRHPALEVISEISRQPRVVCQMLSACFWYIKNRIFIYLLFEQKNFL